MKNSKKENWIKEILPDYDIEATNKYNQFSGRELIIISCSILDLALDELLSRLLVDDSKVQDEFLNYPISSFSSKIKLAYLTGLIREIEYKTINCLREIRNIYAHKVNVDSKHSDIQKAFRKLLATSRFCMNPKVNSKLQNEYIETIINNQEAQDYTIRMILVDYQYNFEKRCRNGIKRLSKCTSRYITNGVE